MHAESDLTDDEAADLVIREMRMHLEEGRKNFALRAPQDMTVYLLSGVLRFSGLSMVALERLMSEQEISGIRSSHDGRVLRRYMSGETRMTWPTYRRLIFWALANGRIRAQAAQDLLFRTFQREAAQVTAREMLRKVRRGQSFDSLSREMMVAKFFQTFEQQHRERVLAAQRNMERNSEVRECAHSLGLGL